MGVDEVSVLLQTHPVYNALSILPCTIGQYSLSSARGHRAVLSLTRARAGGRAHPHIRTQTNTHTRIHTHTHTHTHTHILSLSLSHTHTCTRKHTPTHAHTQRKCRRGSRLLSKICPPLQHTATHCNTLQHTATHNSTQQHTAKSCHPIHLASSHFVLGAPMLSVHGQRKGHLLSICDMTHSYVT